MADQTGITSNPQPQSQTSQSNQLTRNPQRAGLSRSAFDPFFISPREFFSSSPFSLMRRMMDDMDRVFSDLGSSREEGMSTWSPAVEVNQRDGNYIVNAELPGIKPEDVKVELTDGVLVVQGERRSEHQENQGGVRRSERRYGQFYRSIPMPEEIDPEQVRAKFENGVLEITIPIPQQVQNRNRQIPIEGSSQAGPGSKPATSAGAESASSSKSTPQTPSKVA